MHQKQRREKEKKKKKLKNTAANDYKRTLNIHSHIRTFAPTHTQRMYAYIIYNMGTRKHGQRNTIYTHSEKSTYHNISRSPNMIQE